MIRTTGKRLIKTILAGAVILAPVMSAQAACTQADLTGTWYTLGISADLWDRTTEETLRCKLRIGSTGALIATGSSCTLRAATSGTTMAGLTLNVTSGSLRVSSACAITGSVRLCASIGCGTHMVQSAQMAKDKNSFTMIIYEKEYPTYTSKVEGMKQ